MEPHRPLHVLLRHHGPVYEKFFRWLGYGEQIDPMVEAWNAKDKQKAAAEAPWDLIEDTFIGTPEETKARLDAYVAGGSRCR